MWASVSRRAVRWPALSHRSGPPHGADEQRVAREHGYIAPRAVEHHADGIGRAARSVQGPKRELTGGKSVAAVEWLVRVVGAQQSAHPDQGTGGFGNFAVRRDEVGVRVGFDDGDDPGAVRSGIVVVGLRVAGWVDEHDFARTC